MTLLDTALALALVPSRVLGLFSLALALVLSQAQDRAEDPTERVKCEADEFTNVLASSLSAKTVRILHMVIRPCAPMEAWDANRHLHERAVPQGGACCSLRDGIKIQAFRKEAVRKPPDKFDVAQSRSSSVPDL